MARRKTRTYRRSSGGRSFGRGAQTGSIINGALGGAAARFATGYFGHTYGPAVGLGAVGMWRRDATLQTLAGVSIGTALSAGLTLPGSTGAMPPGGFL